MKRENEQASMSKASTPLSGHYSTTTIDPTSTTVVWMLECLPNILLAHVYSARANYSQMPLPGSAPHPLSSPRHNPPSAATTLPAPSIIKCVVHAATAGALPRIPSTGRSSNASTSTLTAQSTATYAHSPTVFTPPPSTDMMEQTRVGIWALQRRGGSSCCWAVVLPTDKPQ
jgi:hypothetical protein